MSVTQATVTSTQEAVKYRRNVRSLSIDMSTDTRPIYRSRSIIASDISVDTAADMSVDMSTDTSRSTHRPRGDRHIGRASSDMPTGISVEMSVDIATEGFVNYT